MSIFDKAKEISSKVVEKTAEFSSDELIANTIIKAVEKQEKVNSILEEWHNKQFCLVCYHWHGIKFWFRLGKMGKCYGSCRNSAINMEIQGKLYLSCYKVVFAEGPDQSHLIGDDCK